MSLTSRIQALTTYANSVTGQSDTTLSDAVASLADGYGGGGGGSIYSGTYTPTEDSVGPVFNIGSSNFSHFIVYATTDPRETSSNKCFLFAYTTFGNADEVTLSSNNTGSSIVSGMWQYSWFTKSGSTVTCTNTGTANTGNAGYWKSGITYQWYAWGF